MERVAVIRRHNRAVGSVRGWRLLFGTVVFVLSPAMFCVWADDLDRGFRDPPHSAGIRAFWWWLNGNVTAEAITRDLEQMKAKGFNGALIFDADGSSQRGNTPVPAGPVFAGPEWTALFVPTMPGFPL